MGATASSRHKREMRRQDVCLYVSEPRRRCGAMGRQERLSLRPSCLNLGALKLGGCIRQHFVLGKVHGRRAPQVGSRPEQKQRNGLRRRTVDEAVLESWASRPVDLTRRGRQGSFLEKTRIIRYLTSLNSRSMQQRSRPGTGIETRVAHFRACITIAMLHLSRTTYSSMQDQRRALLIQFRSVSTRVRHRTRPDPRGRCHSIPISTPKIFETDVDGRVDALSWCRCGCDHGPRLTSVRACRSCLGVSSTRAEASLGPQGTCP